MTVASKRGSFYPQSFWKNQTEVCSRADNLRVEECMRSAQALTDGDRMSRRVGVVGPTLAFCRAPHSIRTSLNLSGQLFDANSVLKR
jgi:hypothetical protein